MAIRDAGEREHPFQAEHVALRRAVLDAVNPWRLVTERLRISQEILSADGVRVPLTGRRVWILAIGKAAVPMANAVEGLLGTQRIAGGAVVTRVGYGGRCVSVPVVEAGHPIPKSTVGADAIESVAGQVKRSDLVLCLLSGGGSALLAAPPPGVTLPQLASMTNLLLHAGADIDAVNTVRRHVSRLQGGRLMAQLHPATVITLVLSDVIGGRLESIASGPTVPDPTTFADARDVLQRFGLWDRVAASIRVHILSGVAGRHPDTEKPGSRVFETSTAILLADNRTAVDAAVRTADALGFAAHPYERILVGEAREEGRRLAEHAVRRGRTSPSKWALIAGGETVVTVRGKGRGGRNQELALAAALALDGTPGTSLTSLATDGTDGPTNAAGALVDGETAALARARGLDLQAALDENDSASALGMTGDLIHTGPTQTNVADVCWVLGEG